MRTNSQPKFLLKLLFSIIGCVIGTILGGVLYEFLPFWTVIPMGQTSDSANHILFVNYTSFEAAGSEKATVYLQTQTGEVYSFSQKKWQMLPTLPDGKTITQIRLKGWDDERIVAITAQGEAYQLLNEQWEFIPNQDFKGFSPSACAAEWYLPAIGVKDSAGRSFGHALADEYVCYVLFNDGRLQVWTRTLDAFSLMLVLVIGALVGLFVGFNAMAIGKHFQNWRKSNK
jgi:hypothetical protein